MAKVAPLPRTVVLLGWVSFFADVSGEMIYPLVPLFVVGILKGSATDLGIIEGIAAAVVAGITAYSGFRSDARRGRKTSRLPWVRWGYGLPVIGKSILALAGSWPVFLIGRAVDRTGKGFRGSPRDALIADAAPAEMRGRAFGFHRKMDSLGATLGVLIALAMLGFLTHWSSSAANADPGEATAYRIVFWTAAALGIASLICTLLVKEASAGSEAASSAPAAATADTATAAAPAAEASPAPKASLPTGFWLALAVMALFAIANSSDMFILLKADETGLSPWLVVLAYAFYNFVYAMVSQPAGALSDRIGRRRVIIAGWIIYAIAYVGFALLQAGSLLELWILLGIYGIYIALTDGVTKAMASDLTPKAIRGRGLGIFYMVTGFAALAGSIIAGRIWDVFGSSSAFWLGAAAAGVSCILAAFWLPRPEAQKSAA